MQSPEEIRYRREERTLELRFATGLPIKLTAEYLRVESPSAEVQGHSPDQKLIVGGKRNVAITKMEPVGNYAIRITFNDGHDTGIFSWDYLRELAASHTRKWGEYEKNLVAKGLTRG